MNKDNIRQLAEAAAARSANQPVTLPDPGHPMDVIRVFVDEQCRTATGELTLRHWRDDWWSWEGPRWVEIERRAVRSRLYDFTEHAMYAKTDKKGDTVMAPWGPSRYKVDNLVDALASVVFLPERVQPPSWTTGVGPANIVACANGLLDVDNRTLMPHTPRFFNTTAVPFDYDADAGDPVEWLGFLNELWEDDTAPIDLLAEWFGYVISGRLDMHKIMLWVGPPRGGKGTMARILGELIGNDNVAGPTLTSLGTDFGLAPLVGKPLAVISDARLNGRASSAVVERLLAISGEDTITVNRKYKDQWTGKLPARFVVVSNELPHLGDAAGAIVSRFVVLMLTRSWLGQEDHQLEQRLRAELPAILSWSLDGLDRLNTADRFTQTAAFDDVVVALTDLASPVSAFVRDRCERTMTGETPIDDMFAAWKSWADDNGQQSGTKQTFGRNLRAAVPAIRLVRPRTGADDERQRVYRGLQLRSQT